MRGNSHVRFLGGGARSNAPLLPDQTLERKQRFIDQLLSGDVSERSIEDVGGAAALTAAEAKTLASGNPEILEVVKLDTEVRRLSALESHHQQTQRHLTWEIGSTERGRDLAQARRGRVLEDTAAAREAWSAAGEKSPGVCLGTRHLRGDGYRKLAADALEDALRQLRRTSLSDGRPKRVEATLGAYLGFELRAAVLPNANADFQTRLWLVRREAYEVSVNVGQPEVSAPGSDWATRAVRGWSMGGGRDGRDALVQVGAERVG